MFKGALFDLDGVIADTASYHFSAWRKLIKKYYNTDLPDSLEDQTKGVSREDSLKVILNYLKLKVDNETFEKLATEKNEMYKISLEDVNEEAILPGISELIKDLRKNNIKIALASASHNGPYILEKLGLLSSFDEIADPAKVNAGKPAPDIFLAAATALDLNPNECIAFEDAVAGVTAINKAGIVSIGIGGNQLNHASKRYLSTSELNFEDIVNVWNKLKNQN